MDKISKADFWIVFLVIINISLILIMEESISHHVDLAGKIHVYESKEYCKNKVEGE